LLQADAARQIAEEIAKLDGAVRVPGVLDGAEDDSKSRADLEVHSHTQQREREKRERFLDIRATIHFSCS
jgi:hypothetical protein